MPASLGNTQVFEASRTLRRHVPESADIAAVGGRNVLVADGATVAILTEQEAVAWNWGALQQLYGSAAVAALRAEVE